jgi:dipeptidyl aminopeptidase/acylaminoacyl peptidase
MHPDGRTLIFSRTEPDFTEKPFLINTYFTLDLHTLAVDTLFQSRWIQNVQWSPDGSRLLVLGGPLTFDGVGKNVPEGTIPNDSDTQAFLYDPNTGGVETISGDFDPKLQSGVWSRSGDAIYFLAEDKSYYRLVRYDVKRGEYQHLDADVEVIREMDLAADASVMLYRGSSASGRPKAYVMDLKKGRSQVLVDPGEADYQHVEFGQVTRWTFKSSRGMEIEGRVYTPPGFDAERTYPCIVYYYAGTSPVERDFGGRYPKEIWAANGYVVYVLQPSGATGFGQAFSALHVNDWGKITSEDIIEGTEKFLEAHPFVDRGRVGCIGASYGGFMTMLLVTRTDLFAAAVSHAGISSISSYWGEGFWGYWYLGLSATGSFPWNRKDIYVDQSPLFSADRVNTPLLMTHGAEDTNVPPGESRQFYTALKLLGKEVDLIEVDDQNHWIMEYDKRIRWTKSIIAWFDRWLKDQPEWWEDLYPEL